MTNECGVVQSGVASGSRIVRATFRPVGNTSASSSSLCKYISNIIVTKVRSYNNITTGWENEHFEEKKNHFLCNVCIVPRVGKSKYY